MEEDGATRVPSDAGQTSPRSRRDVTIVGIGAFRREAKRNDILIQVPEEIQLISSKM